MPLTIISRRSITYRETGRGEMTVLLVPGRDQIQIVKDLAGLGTTTVAATKEAGPNKGAATGRKLAQLSRVFIGRRFIYGTLPQEINDLRQPVKIWLAEDYAPAQSQAFFYIISNSVVIHGVREQDDEGFQNWRTAQLPIDATDPLKAIINAISDYALANPLDNLTVAVLNKLDLYEKLQQGLVTYNISPIPFSKLRPMPNLKPLYRHRDFTVLYLTLAFFGFIGVIACGVYGLLTWLNLGKLAEEAQDIQRRIDEIKLNQNVGRITDPQTVLKAMARPVNQQPSAILDAAGIAASKMGELATIRAVFAENADGNTNITPLPAGQVNVVTRISKFNQELLLMQEKEAKQILVDRPWIREIHRGGSVGTQGEIILTLQVDQAPSSNAPEVVAEPVSPTESLVSTTDPVSATAPVSSSAPVSATTDASVSLVPAVAVSPTETQGSVPPSPQAATKGEGK
jgi:hypothetical protein